MTRPIIQSKINAVKARIEQIKVSLLFTESDRIQLLEVNQKELDKLEDDLSKLIEVNNPEIL